MIFKELSKAEAADYYMTDVNVQKRGYQTGLETRVVHAVTYEC